MPIKQKIFTHISMKSIVMKSFNTKLSRVLINTNWKGYCHRAMDWCQMDVKTQAPVRYMRCLGKLERRIVLSFNPKRIIIAI